MAFMFRKMVVVGVGLIGGSLALATRKRGLVEEVFGYGREEKNLRVAQRMGLIDGYFLHSKGFPKGVDLMILATPVEAIAPLAASFLPRLEPGCLVSDVGSVKEKIVRQMEKLLPSRIPFVGAHPIAGSELWGAAAARADLFAGQRCILTPTRNSSPGGLKKLSALWRRVGATVEVMDPTVHDRILGVVSHVPHVLAYAMVTTLKRTRVDSKDLKQYCSGGFRDFTRIASSRPEIWRDICLANQRAIGLCLGDYIKHLMRLRRWIRDGQGRLLEREFTEANQLRRQLSD